MPEIELLSGLPARQIPAAASLLLDAFDAKLPVLVGHAQVGQRVLAASLEPALFLAAMRDGELLGLCGVRWRGCNCLCVSLRLLARELGLRRALPRWAALTLGHRALPADALYVDQLAVAAPWRSQGIGTRLLAEAAALAGRQGRSRVLLDVVDTNPRARALYERLGFCPVKTQRAPGLERWLGFGAVTLMALDLTACAETHDSR